MKANKPFRVRLSHFPHDVNFLHTGTATSADECDICHAPIASGATYYYYDVGLHDTKPVIGIECHHKLAPMSYQKPYWLSEPNKGSCDNIRTSDDKGWREYIDGVMDEWDVIWGDDLKKWQ